MALQRRYPAKGIIPHFASTPRDQGMRRGKHRHGLIQMPFPIMTIVGGVP
jgi:hypothetical protein